MQSNACSETLFGLGLIGVDPAMVRLHPAFTCITLILGVLTIGSDSWRAVKSDPSQDVALPTSALDQTYQL